MRMYPSIKRILSLLMVFAMLLSTALPVAAEESAPEQTGELYAKVAGSENPVQKLTVPAGKSLQVELYFGGSPVTDSAELESAGLQLRNDGNGAFTISRADAESGTITHIASGSKIAVTFESSKEPVNTEPPATETQPIAPAAENPEQDSEKQLHISHANVRDASLSMTISNGTAVNFLLGNLETTMGAIIDPSLLSWGGLTYAFDSTNGSYTLTGEAGRTYTVTHIETNTSVTVTIEGTPEQAPEKWLHISHANVRDASLSMTISNGTAVNFLLGNSETTMGAIIDPSLLSWGGLTYAFDSTNGSYTLTGEVGRTHTVTHIETNTSVTVTFEGSSGEDGNSGNPTLFAMYHDEYRANFTLKPGSGDYFDFYYGDHTKLSEADKLGSDSVLSYDRTQIEVDYTTDGWNVCVKPSATAEKVTISYQAGTFDILIDHSSSGGQQGGGESGPNGGNQQILPLFAKWPDSGEFAENVKLDQFSSVVVKFYYGTSKENCVEVPWGSQLEYGGVASCTPAETSDWGNYVYWIGVTDAGTATITYTDATGTKYTYTYTGTAQQGGDQGGGDSGSGNPTLFAMFHGEYRANFTLKPGSGDYFDFYYGDHTNLSEADKLGSDSVLSYDRTQIEVDYTTDGWNVCVKPSATAEKVTISYLDGAGTFDILIDHSSGGNQGGGEPGPGSGGQEPGPGSGGQQGPCLYATWPSGMGFLTNYDGVEDGGINLRFFFRDGNGTVTEIKDIDLLGESERVTLTREGDSWSVKLFGSNTEGVVIYMYNGEPYSFQVTKASGGQSGGQGGGDESNLTLFAKNSMTGDYLSELNLPSVTDSVFLQFYFGDFSKPANATPVTGSVQADGPSVGIRPAGDNGVLVSLNPGNTSGTITYTAGDKTYSFKVSFKEPELTLFAKNSMTGDYLSELNLPSVTDSVFLQFYFGDFSKPANATPVTGSVQADGPSVGMQPAGDNGVRVGLNPGHTSGAITYTAGDKTYTFNVSFKEPELTLFAKNSMTGDYLSELNLPSVTDSVFLQFYFGDFSKPANATPVTGSVQADGPSVGMQPAGDNGVRVGLNPGHTSGAITYTAGSKTYTFNVSSGESEQPEGPDLSQLPDGPCLYATRTGDDSTEAFTETWAGSRLRFYFRDSENKTTEITDVNALAVSFGVVLKFEWSNWCIDMLPGITEGTITYTHDGQTYTFKVKGSADSQGSNLVARFAGTNAVQYELRNMERDSNLVVFYHRNANTGEWVTIPNDNTLTFSNLTATYKGTVDGENDVWEVSFPRGIYTGTVTHTTSDTSIVMRMSGDMEHMDDVVGSIGGAAGGGAPIESDGSHYVTVKYGKQKVSVGIGFFQQETQTLNSRGFGDQYSSKYIHRFGFEFILAALENMGDTKEAPASQDFLNCISNVRFYIPYWKNEDGSTDVSNCMLSTSAEPFEAGNVDTWRTLMVADNGSGFDCQLAMDFTYTEPGKQPVTYTVTMDGGYHGVQVMDIHADDPTGPAGAYLDTAKKLNAVLSSRENLKAWLAEYFPDEYALYGKVDPMTIYLPAVEYDDVIVMNCPFDDEGWTSIAIYGTDGGYLNPQTIMPGFVHKGGGSELRYIHFQGDPNKTVTYKNSKPFTCGVLMDGPANQYNDMIGVGSCIFENLDYGTYSTETGFTGRGTDSLYRNCTYGMYIDCKGKQNGAPNDEFTHMQFINCKVAVWIKSLPDYITPYMIRVVDNTFLNNQHDIKVTTPGRHYYYFYRNYYYGTYNELSPVSDMLEGRAAIVDTEGQGAVVNTGPSRRYQDFNSELWIFEDSTSILNSEASNLKIDQDSLTNLSKEKEIAVVDNAASGEAVAIWTFGTEGGAAE